MAEERITDANNKTIGYLKDAGGRKIVTDANNLLKGHYDPVRNMTFTANNMLVGNGDQRTRLLGPR